MPFNLLRPYWKTERGQLKRTQGGDGKTSSNEGRSKSGIKMQKNRARWGCPHMKRERETTTTMRKRADICSHKPSSHAPRGPAGHGRSYSQLMSFTACFSLARLNLHCYGLAGRRLHEKAGEPWADWCLCGQPVWPWSPLFLDLGAGWLKLGPHRQPTTFQPKATELTTTTFARSQQSQW